MTGAADPSPDDGRRPDEPTATDAWTAQMNALGGFIRAQRQLANLSLRELAGLTRVSNAYLSQIERGLHQPSLKVLVSIADALHLSTEQLLGQTGWLSDAASSGGSYAAGSAGSSSGHPEAGPAQRTTPPDTEEAIRADRRLTEAQRSALIGVYRSFVGDVDRTA